MLDHYFVGLAAAVQLTRSGGCGRRVVAVLVPWWVLAVYLGLGYRILTAGVIGANIGGGLFVLTSFVVVPVAVVSSVAVWWVTRNRVVDPQKVDRFATPRCRPVNAVILPAAGGSKLKFLVRARQRVAAVRGAR